jgi:hypothetical protein
LLTTTEGRSASKLLDTSVIESNSTFGVRHHVGIPTNQKHGYKGNTTVNSEGITGLSCAKGLIEWVRKNSTSYITSAVHP